MPDVTELQCACVPSLPSAGHPIGNIATKPKRRDAAYNVTSDQAANSAPMVPQVQGWGEVQRISLRQRISSLACTVRGEHYRVKISENDMAPIL
ncbi:hypothetical protein HaLaN_32381 [Haematococcus lacustris]|uniref:Uncharacterized protein n=1 Tax=Haematococcus lacustris TaxID=44745 RepID=A0A6A0AJT3_HAELA|nr:hypothetical protein HaLaN_32381 [Haematococcus lacustris]